MTVSIHIPDYLPEVQKVNRNIAQKFTKDLFFSLAAATPVDTGTARASWQVLPEGGIPKKLPRKKYGFPAPPNLKFMDAGLSAVLFNSVPYMVYLNEGWSSQAASGFIDATVAAVSRRYQ